MCQIYYITVVLQLGWINQNVDNINKSLMILKGQPESVSRWRTDNTMAKRKGTNNELQYITYKTKDHREIRTPLKPGSESRCSGRVVSSCCTSCTRRVNLVTHPVISHKWGKDREVFRQVERIRGHLWHIYSVTVN
jgi:hypothetical protein